VFAVAYQSRYRYCGSARSWSVLGPAYSLMPPLVVVVVVVAIAVILVVVMVLNAQASQHNFKIDALFLCFRSVKFVRQS